MTAKNWDELTLAQMRIAMAAFGYSRETLTQWANAYTVSADGTTISQRPLSEFAGLTWDELTDGEQQEVRSVLLADDDDPESWLYSRSQGGAVWTKAPRIRTPEEIADLKAQWRADPCWDIEDTAGYEHHRHDLLAYSQDWKRMNSEHNDRIEEDEAKRSLVYKLLAEQLAEVQARLADAEETIMALNAAHLAVEA